ncbi:MAG TPA: sialate O-acetylesterase, partial [Flavisolibacter sp.]|nr:sialate O-acetylesterase [Flavisolibacter sp.]
MMTRFRTSIFLFALQLFALSVYADIKLVSPFGDHMVLQQGTKVPVWGTADPAERVTVSFLKQKFVTTTDANGQWKISLNKLAYGGPYSITVSGKNTVILKDVYVGEVWLCSGQSNMDMTVAREDRYWCGVFNEAEEVASANYPTIRFFDVDFTPNEKQQKEVRGKWEVVSPQTVGHMSAAAYFFARDLQKKLGVPVGLLTTAFGASTAEAWIRKEALQANPRFTYILDTFQSKLNRYYADTAATRKYAAAYEKWKIDAAKAKAEGKDEVRSPRNPNPANDQHNPYVLWNGMVAPLVPYAIKGALWYQGESNGPTAKIYKDIMETLIADWRLQWGGEPFPFIYVQLANHQKLITEPVKDDPMVTVRDAQLQNLSLPNTAMVVAIDNANPGDPNDIHPKNKQDIGKRLALAALRTAYKQKVVYSGPLYESLKVEGNKIRLQFKHTGSGLMTKGDTLKGFAIAGADKKFLHADAVIERNTIVLWNAAVPVPAAVRYGWSKNPPVNLYNKEGLPASPFK